MNRIDCGVTNCSHNNNEVCHASTINVTGGATDDKEHTSCASFLNSLVYSDLTNEVNEQSGSCSSIGCDVESCKFNSNQICSADSIMVNGNEVNLYSETNCSTFEARNE